MAVLRLKFPRVTSMLIVVEDPPNATAPPRELNVPRCHQNIHSAIQSPIQRIESWIQQYIVCGTSSAVSQSVSQSVPVIGPEW